MEPLETSKNLSLSATDFLENPQINLSVLTLLLSLPVARLQTFLRQKILLSLNSIPSLMPSWPYKCQTTDDLIAKNIFLLKI
jgi:hypothetical protein